MVEICYVWRSDWLNFFDIHTEFHNDLFRYSRTYGEEGIASVVFWSEFMATNPEVPGSITGSTIFSEKYVWDGVHSASYYVCMYV
jgi:hypothetical protein